jgi:hypothetical protein
MLRPMFGTSNTEHLNTSAIFAVVIVVEGE